jgi:hypothetical protein
MKLSLQQTKQFIQDSPQDSFLYVFAIYYYGDCSFDRLIFPTVVVPSLDTNNFNKLSFFKVSSHGKKLKSKISYIGNKTHTSLHIFDNEQECLASFKKEFDYLKSIILEDQNTFNSLIQELNSF